jgi:hypothetical protein
MTDGGVAVHLLNDCHHAFGVANREDVSAENITSTHFDLHLSLGLGATVSGRADVQAYITIDSTFMLPLPAPSCSLDPRPP